MIAERVEDSRTKGSRFRITTACHSRTVNSSRHSGGSWAGHHRSRGVPTTMTAPLHEHDRGRGAESRCRCSGVAAVEKADRGPFPRPDRLDPPQARQGRARGRRRRRPADPGGDLRAADREPARATPPNEFHQDLIDPLFGTPKGALGGISSDFLLGVEPRQRPRHLQPASSTAPGSRCSSPSSRRCVAVVLGTVLGVVAGYFGGWVDSVISRVMDMLLAFPQLLFAIALVSVLPERPARA